MTTDKKNKYEDRFKEADKAFNDEFKDRLAKLKGLSQKEVDAATPGTAEHDVYQKLVKVVEKAISDNLSQAELITNIQALGEVAIKVASKIPEFAALL
jgi:hypothetical protein